MEARQRKDYTQSVCGGELGAPILEIMSEDTTFKCGDGTDMAAYVARPSAVSTSVKLPGVIVIHEAFGLNGQIKSVVRRYAGEGFVGIAPNLFERNGDIMNEKNIESAMKLLWSLPPERRNDPDAIRELAKKMPQTERKVMEIFYLGREAMEKQMAADLMSCKDYVQRLRYVRGDRLGITGFCMGGGLTFQLSTMYHFSASVPFYGSNPKPLESVANISGPVLAFYAGEDERVNAGVPSLVEAMLKYKRDFCMKVYKGAQHSFFNETRPVYHKEAAEDAWENAVAFFIKHLQG
jgi:carboxymethylenebutenolidase